ncbi:hypothetical protein [Mucilaginibacter ginsenosidivorax]|uniref:Uncharacterized protein n=1 Tax=Mucilaginibacter ginsenosidivorax TaxID=862126 RepID=A0A5B8W157_9SPHI|nr:hypothetical protein [Mucilaginibacter ginsenosidivorax]QEC77564.1 hypothetical protein FSB76_17030 [Mucilaginibacter ginsenosidivorax]
MSAKQSFLSDPHYGYDFVVATTQASINSTMKEYLYKIKQPTTYICFLADSLGNPTTPITVEDLVTKTGINPFDIPDGTPYNDARITKLTQSMFVCALKITAGLPAGILPANLPPTIDLGSSASNVTFNLLCSEFTVIQNSPPSGFGGVGSWNVWSQPSDTPWYFSNTVNLVYADLDRELNTTYFNNHPDEQAALKAKLYNLGSGAFSIQQLLFDLDNAALQTVPTFKGIPPGSNAALMLTKSFTNLYFGILKNEGEPILSVRAISNTPDGSTLRLTAMERVVDQFVDGNGIVISSPTPEQKNVAALCYVCAADNKPLPALSSFTWNWVEPSEVDDESGIIAINRNTIANYFKNQLMQTASRSCIGVSVYVSHNSDSWITGVVNYSWTLTKNNTPQTAAVVSEAGNLGTIIRIGYTSEQRDTTDSGATHGELDLGSSYDCTVSVSGNQLTIVQHLKIHAYVKWDLSGTGCDVYNKTITDVYTLSASQSGDLLLSAPVSTTNDQSEDPDPSWLDNLFTNIKDIANDVKNTVTGFVGTSFTSYLPGADLRNFVFPGTKVFAYKDASFSDNQDLVCKITYQSPS